MGSILTSSAYQRFCSAVNPYDGPRPENVTRTLGLLGRARTPIPRMRWASPTDLGCDEEHVRSSAADVGPRIRSTKVIDDGVARAHSKSRRSRSSDAQFSVQHIGKRLPVEPRLICQRGRRFVGTDRCRERMLEASQEEIDIDSLAGRMDCSGTSAMDHDWFASVHAIFRDQVPKTDLVKLRQSQQPCDRDVRLALLDEGNKRAGDACSFRQLCEREPTGRAERAKPATKVALILLKLGHGFGGESRIRITPMLSAISSM